MPSNEFNPDNGANTEHHSMFGASDNASNLNRDFTGQPVRKTPVSHDSLGGIDSEFDDRLFSLDFTHDDISLHIQSHLYGDEFKSGISPIDHAAHFTGRGFNQLDKAVETGTQAIGGVINHSVKDFSETISHSIDSIQQSWEAPGNNAVRALKKWGNQTSNFFRQQIANASTQPNVQAFMDGTDAVWRNVVAKAEQTVQSAQETTQNLLGGVYGESYFEKSQSLALPALSEYQEIQGRDDKLEIPQSSLEKSLDLLNRQKNADEPELGKLKRHQEELNNQLNTTQQQLNTARFEYQQLVLQHKSLTPKSVLENKIEEYTSGRDRQALQSLLQLDIPDIKAVDELILQHKGLLEKYRNNIEYVVKTYDLPNGEKAQSTPIPINPLAKYIPEQELIITTLEATQELFITESDRLSTEISEKRESVEDLELRPEQLNEDRIINDRALNSVQAAVKENTKAIANVEDQLKIVREQKSSTQQELQDFLDRYGHFLPEAELQSAIAERLQYAQTQFDKAAAPEEQASLQQQLDWLKLKQTFALDDSNLSLKEEWNGLIVDLQGRKDAMEKSGKQTLPLQQYIQFLTEAESNKVYVPEDIGGLRDRLTALSKNQTELEGMLSDLGNAYNSLKAAPQDQMTQENSALLQQSEKDIRLFQRVAVALNYEADQVDIWIKFLDHIDTPTQDRQQLNTMWQEAEATWGTVTELIQMRQGFVVSQGDTNVLKSFIYKGVKQLQELSPVNNLSNQLKSLIDFGLLANEIQPDFFKTRVAPQVHGFIEDLRNWNQSLTNISQTLTQLVQTIQPALTFDTGFIQVVQDQLKQITVVQTQIRSNLEELQTTLSESEQPLSMLQQQQQLDQELKLKQNEQQASWLREQQAITQKIQSGSFNPGDLKQYLGQLLQDSASSLKGGHSFGEELLKLRETQANRFEQSAGTIRNELLPVYGSRELTEASLRDSITTVATLKEVHDGLAQAVNTFKDEMEALQLDIRQGNELQQQFAHLQKRYVDSAQTLESEIDKLSLSIESGLNQANSRINDIEQEIKGLYESARAADEAATNAVIASTEFAKKSQEERRRIALEEFGNKDQILEGRRYKSDYVVNPVDASGRIQLSYIEDPNDNWGNSGETWTPVRRFDLAGNDNYRRKKGQTHVDGNWIAWNTKIQELHTLQSQAKTYRDQAAQLEQGEELKHWRDLKAQWEVVTQISNDSKNSIKEIQRLLTVDTPAVQEETAKASERLQKIQGLLPTLSQRFEVAKGELQSSQAKLDANWSAYSTSADLHLQAMIKALNSYNQWDSDNLEYQVRLDEVEVWTEQQGNALTQQTDLIQALRKSLQEQLATIESQLSELDGDDRDTLEHQKATLQQSLKLVDNVSNVFELQKGSLKNLQQLEESHESISVNEQQLMRDYVSNPDSDGQVLEEKLELARQTQAETDRLARQAEDSSKTLDTSTLDFKNLSLEAQNEYLQATQQLQPVLDELKDAVKVSTQSALNLKDAQGKLISSSSEIKQVLDAAIAAGDQEAVALRDVANYQRMETAAQLYARDFQDLTNATKKKGMRRIYGSLLEKYAQDAQHFEGLKTEAGANAETARLARIATEDKLKPLKEQQEENQSEINRLRTAMNSDLDNQDQTQQKLDAALLKQQIIGAVVQKTEQTLEDLLSIDGLNLAQARLEQRVAANWVSDLEQDISSHFKQDLQENQHQQLEKVIDILQVGQHQTEVQLQEALNEVRSDLGMEPLNLVPSQANQQEQMQILLKDLQTLQAEQLELPENLKILLGDVEKDLNSALQGEEASAIQVRLDNLVTELTAQNKRFIEQVNQLGAENEKDLKLLGLLNDGNLSGGKLQELASILGEIRGSDEEIRTLMEGIGDLHLQLGINSQRIASAEKLVEFSGEMDTQLHQFMTELIKQRIEVRRAEAGSTWSKIRLGITIVGGAVATVLTAGGAAPLTALAVSLAVGAMNSIDGAVRGDWMDVAGGLLSIGGAVTGYLGQVGTLTKTATATIQQSTSSAYRSTRAFIKGEDFIGALEAAGGLIAVTNYSLSSSLNGLSEMDRNVAQGVLDTLQYVPQNLSMVIAAVKNDDLLGALDGGFNIAVNLGQGFTPLLGSSIGKVVDQANKLGNTALILAQGANNDGFIDLQGLVSLYGNDIHSYAEREKHKAAIQAQGHKSQSETVIETQKREPQKQEPQNSIDDRGEKGGYQKLEKKSAFSSEEVNQDSSQRNSPSSHSVVAQKGQHSKPSVSVSAPSTSSNPETNGSNPDISAPPDNLAPSGTAQPSDISTTPTAEEERLGMSLPDPGLNGELSTPTSDAITPTAEEERLGMSLPDPGLHGTRGTFSSTVQQAGKEEDLGSTHASQGAGGASQGSSNIGFGGGRQGPEPSTSQSSAQASDQNNIGTAPVRIIHDGLKRFRNTLNRLAWTDAAEEAYQKSKDPTLEKVQSNPHLEVLDQVVKETPSISGDLWLEGTALLGSGKQGVDLVSQTLEQADYLIQLNKTGGIPREVAIVKGNQVLGAAENVSTGQRFFGRSSKAIATEELYPALGEELKPYAKIIEGSEGFARYGPPGAHAEINALNKALWAADPTGKMLTTSDFSNFNSVAVWLGKGGPYTMPRCPNCWFLTPNVNYLGPQPLRK